ncbi:polymerase/histidinol phosphatase domain-containing protein [Desulfonema limicola]|uniref:Polymerase/histidinol phosphatase domain-containing protein n=1 Tax=Desulfonema limicola TaxID=45656 RepID=A0A975BCH7_9BACT|nr:PHP domain-containing protein [Desulfonema limicola]QTA82674.1 polymerase/histidinol phosphatase domain-containing protein [Desulfonema limicola]
MGCKDNLRIDLHIHSTASDGTFSPLEILSLAEKLKLGAISITDHDTVAGCRQVHENGIPGSICFLNGIEISAASPSFFPCSGSFHILGYGIKLDDPDLNQALISLQEARTERNPQIIEILNNMGFDISCLEVLEYAKESQIGRPHIAGLMKQKGYVESINEAFDKYLGTDKPAYVDKYRISCEKAIQIITNAGGIPVIAHPGLLKPLSNLSFEHAVSRLKSMGIQGIEVYYPAHSKEQTNFFSQTADQFGLLKTGGTDFHGAVSPGISMGTGKGNFFVSYSIFEKLIERL